MFLFSGDTVHLMSITSTPYGASSSSSSDFSCILNSPDTDQLNNIIAARHVMRGRTSPYNTLSLPSSGSSSVPAYSYRKTSLSPSSSLDAQGVYYCEATSRGLTTRVPVTILASNSKYTCARSILQTYINLHVVPYSVYASFH